MPRAQTMAPGKRATDLKIPWHNLVHFCCAKLCCSKFRLFQNPPPPPGMVLRFSTQYWLGRCKLFCFFMVIEAFVACVKALHNCTTHIPCSDLFCFFWFAHQ